jgi:hypothetical protein
MTIRNVSPRAIYCEVYAKVATLPIASGWPVYF